MHSDGNRRGHVNIDEKWSSRSDQPSMWLPWQRNSGRPAEGSPDPFSVYNAERELKNVSQIAERIGTMEDIFNAMPTAKLLCIDGHRMILPQANSQLSCPSFRGR